MPFEYHRQLATYRWLQRGELRVGHHGLEVVDPSRITYAFDRPTGNYPRGIRSHLFGSPHVAVVALEHVMIADDYSL